MDVVSDFDDSYAIIHSNAVGTKSTNYTKANVQVHVQVPKVVGT
jgi:hypothetical protein